MDDEMMCSVNVYGLRFAGLVKHDKQGHIFPKTQPTTLYGHFV